MRHETRDDRGAAAIFVIVAMTVVLLGTGFAIDVGRYVFEARSAQNSADATALAVATDCANHGGPIADYTPYRKDGQSISMPFCGDGETTITVDKEVDNLFLRQSAGSVDRAATAAWDPIGGATTVPIVISDCEFSYPDLDTVNDIIVYLDDTKPQSGCSSLPGGFSQLRGDGCEVELTAGATGSVAPGKPGADLQKTVPCITDAQGNLPNDILVPMYDSAACAASGCKGNGVYPIVGFAAFRITGYSFNGNAYGGSLGKKCPDDKERGKYCIRGDFVRFTTAQGTPGPGVDFGVYTVHLVK